MLQTLISISIPWPNKQCDFLKLVKGLRKLLEGIFFQVKNSPEVVVARTGNKVKLGVDFPALALRERGLHAEMLSMPRVHRDPLQQPMVALVFAWNLERHQQMAPCRYVSILHSLLGDGQQSANADQSKSSAKVRILL